MCYTGGPRCEADAKKILRNAIKRHKKDPTEETAAALTRAKIDYACTPGQIAKIAKKEPEKAEALQKRHDRLLTGFKEYEAIRLDNKASLEKIHSELEELKGNQQRRGAEAQELASKIQVAEWLEVDSRDSPNADHEKEDLDDDRHSLHQVEKSIKEGNDRVKRLEGYAETLKEANERNLKLREAGKPVAYSHYMPAKFDDYFKQTEAKHFREGSPGSQFTECNNLNEVLALTHKQRGSLEGDDRKELIRRGADPSSFQEGKRYLMVQTAGKLGAVNSSQIPPETMVTVVQKAEGVKPVCVANVQSKPSTNIATIVLVDDPEIPGTEKSPSLLITAHPGVGGASGSNNDLLPYVGKKMTVAEARKIYGRDFQINTQVKEATSQ